jgi:predicted permease
LIVLSIIIGAVAVGTIAYAAIIYASARDEQSKVSEAKTIVRNVMIGLLLYGFTIAIINWLLPGGVIDTSSPPPSVSPSPSSTP